MTKKNIDKLAYAFLFAALLLGIVTIFSSRANATAQLVVIMLLIAFYLTWGFVYHHLRGDATRQLMFEYLIISAIGLLTGIFVFYL